MIKKWNKNIFNEIIDYKDMNSSLKSKVKNISSNSSIEEFEEIFDQYNIDFEPILEQSKSLDEEERGKLFYTKFREMIPKKYPVETIQLVKERFNIINSLMKEYSSQHNSIEYEKELFDKYLENNSENWKKEKEKRLDILIKKLSKEEEKLIEKENNNNNDNNEKKEKTNQETPIKSVDLIFEGNDNIFSSSEDDFTFLNNGEESFGGSETNFNSINQNFEKEFNPQTNNLEIKSEEETHLNTPNDYQEEKRQSSPINKSNSKPKKAIKEKPIKNQNKSRKKDEITIINLRRKITALESSRNKSIEKQTKNTTNTKIILKEVKVEDVSYDYLNEMELNDLQELSSALGFDNKNYNRKKLTEKIMEELETHRKKYSDKDINNIVEKRMLEIRNKELANRTLDSNSLGNELSDSDPFQSKSLNVSNPFDNNGDDPFANKIGDSSNPFENGGNDPFGNIENNSSNPFENGGNDPFENVGNNSSNPFENNNNGNNPFGNIGDNSKNPFDNKENDPFKKNDNNSKSLDLLDT